MYYSMYRLKRTVHAYTLPAVSYTHLDVYKRQLFISAGDHLRYYVTIPHVRVRVREE